MTNTSINNTSMDIFFAKYLHMILFFLWQYFMEEHLFLGVTK